MSRKLVVTFMDLVQEGKHADAVMMLHKLDKANPYSTPELLDNQEIESVMKMLKQFQVQSYTIQSITYDSAVNNPTNCSVWVLTPANKEPLRTTWVLNPINYLGEWKLCFAEK